MNLIAAFAAIGGGLKFIDEAFDEDVFSKTHAKMLAPILVVVWIAVSVIDEIAATILFAILAGVLLSGKIDNFIFKASTLAVILAAPLSGRIGILWPPFLALTLAGIVDEIGNNYADRNSLNRAVEFFFLHRFTMKVGVFVLSAMSILPWAYLAAFLAFDLSYDIVGMVGQWIHNSAIVKKQFLIGVPNVRIFTTAVMLCKEVPRGMSEFTFYRSERFEFKGILSSIALA